MFHYLSQKALINEHDFMEGEASENFGFQILNTTNLQKQHKDIL
jgi:hypothetical protein